MKKIDVASSLIGSDRIEFRVCTTEVRVVEPIFARIGMGSLLSNPRDCPGTLVVYVELTGLTYEYASSLYFALLVAGKIRSKCQVAIVGQDGPVEFASMAGYLFPGYYTELFSLRVKRTDEHSVIDGILSVLCDYVGVLPFEELCQVFSFAGFAETDFEFIFSKLRYVVRTIEGTKYLYSSIGISSSLSVKIGDALKQMFPNKKMPEYVLEHSNSDMEIGFSTLSLNDVFDLYFDRKGVSAWNVMRHIDSKGWIVDDNMVVAVKATPVSGNVCDNCDRLEDVMLCHIGGVTFNTVDSGKMYYSRSSRDLAEREIKFELYHGDCDIKSQVADAIARLGDVDVRWFVEPDNTKAAHIGKMVCFFPLRNFPSPNAPPGFYMEGRRVDFCDFTYDSGGVIKFGEKTPIRDRNEIGMIRKMFMSYDSALRMFLSVYQMSLEQLVIYLVSRVLADYDDVFPRELDNALYQVLLAKVNFGSKVDGMTFAEISEYVQFRDRFKDFVLRAGLENVEAFPLGKMLEVVRAPGEYMDEVLKLINPSSISANLAFLAIKCGAELPISNVSVIAEKGRLIPTESLLNFKARNMIPMIFKSQDDVPIEYRHLRTIDLYGVEYRNDSDEYRMLNSLEFSRLEMVCGLSGESMPKYSVREISDFVLKTRDPGMRGGSIFDKYFRKYLSPLCDVKVDLPMDKLNFVKIEIYDG